MNGINDFDGIRPTETSVKKCGRTYWDGNILWMGLSGTGMEFEADGSFCELAFVGDDSAPKVWADVIQARIAVFLDGELVVDFLMDEGEKTVEVFKGQERKRIVRVVKMSEALHSTTGIRGIRTDGNICPTTHKKLKLEFIGDSITCGFGVDYVQNKASMTAHENVAKSYGYLTALELDADYSLVAYSGYGVVSGHTSGFKESDKTVPDYYSRFGKSNFTFANGLLPGKIGWDHKYFVPHMVIINLGTNDYSYTGSNEARKREFMEGYCDFLSSVRMKNPKSYILCTLGMVGDELYEKIEEAVESFKARYNDARVSCMKFHDQLAEDGYGLMMHPSEITHYKAAKKLSSHILSLKDGVY